MPRTYYDDGSWIDVDEYGTSIAANTAGVPVSKVEADGDYFQSPLYWTDAREATKLEPFAARPTGDTRPWYERVAEYGITRAIDSNYGPQWIDKGRNPATFAGQNGRTYSQVGVPQYAPGGGSNWLPLLIAGAAAFFALS